MIEEDQLLSSMKIKFKMSSRRWRQEERELVEEEDLEEGEVAVSTESENPTTVTPSTSTPLAAAAAAMVEKKGTTSGKGVATDSKQAVGTEKTCHVCNRTFMNGKALGGHMRVHLHRHRQHHLDNNGRRLSGIGSSSTPSSNSKGGGSGDASQKLMKKKNQQLSYNPSTGTYDSALIADKDGDVYHNKNPSSDFNHGEGYNTSPPVVTTRKCACPVCDKEFKNLKSLFGHMRCHPEREWRGIQPPKFSCESGSSTADYGSCSSSPAESSDKAAENTRASNSPSSIILASLRSMPGNWGKTRKRGRREGEDSDDDVCVLDLVPQGASDLMWLANGGGAGIVVCAAANKRLKIDDDIDKVDKPLFLTATRVPPNSTGPFFGANVEYNNNTFENEKRSDVEIEDNDKEGSGSDGGDDGSGRGGSKAIHDVDNNGKGKSILLQANDDDNCDSMDQNNNKSLLLLEGSYDSDDEYWLQDHFLEETVLTPAAYYKTNQDVLLLNSPTPAPITNPNNYNLLAPSPSSNYNKLAAAARKKNSCNNSESTAPASSSSPAAARALKFKCTTCKKTFPTYQALGGHRSSHYKERLNNHQLLFHDHHDSSSVVPAADRTTLLDADRDHQMDHLTYSQVLHKCKICNKTFPTGQALGGHQRSHWISPPRDDNNNNNQAAAAAAAGHQEDHSLLQLGAIASTSNVQMGKKTPLELDLNHVPNTISMAATAGSTAIQHLQV